MANPTQLGARLSSAIGYIKQGERVADIGTDHAYLPIHLVQKGIASRVLATDINEGPLESARINLAEAGLTSSIDLLLTDGLCGVETWQPDRILIFGMGGELIARILSEAAWVKSSSVGLVLQPMSRASVLRKYLNENGFVITGETITFEDRFYQTISAEWTPTGEAPYSDVELLLGRRNIECRPPLYEDFLRHEQQVLERIVRGKQSSVSSDASQETALLDAIKQELGGLRK